MPDTNVPNRPQPPGRPVVSRTTLADLAGAHAHVRPEGEAVAVSIGDVHGSVHLVDVPSVVRQLLTDAVAQIAATALLLRVMTERNFTLGVAYSKTELIQVAVFGLVFLGALEQEKTLSLLRGYLGPHATLQRVELDDAVLRVVADVRDFPEESQNLVRSARELLRRGVVRGATQQL